MCFDLLEARCWLIYVEGDRDQTAGSKARQTMIVLQCDGVTFLSARPSNPSRDVHEGVNGRGFHSSV